MTVRLLVLGAPVVTRDGAPVTFDTRKATAILAYLAATGRAQPRAALAAVGWPEVERERAGAALRRTLSTIRTSAGPEVLLTEGDRIALDRAALTVDLWEARAARASITDHGHGAAAACARCVTALTPAAERYRGPFLQGFGLRDSPDFEEWRFITAEITQHEHATVLSLLAEAHVLAGDLPQAITVALRRLELDVLHEPTHRMLMELYAWSGDRASALRQYRACVRALETDLGVRPLDETTAVYEAIVAERLAPAPVPLPDPVAPARGAPSPGGAETARVARPTRHDGAGARRARKLAPRGGAAPARGDGPRRPPFVARDAELAALRRIITGLDRGGAIAVEGEAGIGKTRLLDELLTGPVSAERVLLRLTCQQDEVGLALGLVMEALRAAGQGTAVDWRATLPAHTLREVGRVLPELTEHTGGPPPATDPGAAWRLRDALASALAAAVTAAGGPPGLLVVDDAHWLDESSLDVLAHLAHRLDRHRVGIVLSWRSDLIERGHRLRRLVADLARDGRGHTVVLTRLGPGAVRLLVEDMVSAQEASLDELTARVMASTEGVPLLVVEYLTALAVDPGALDGPPPRGAADLFHARLAAIGDTARQILTTAAVIGRSFDPDLVRRASGRSEEESATALEELVASGLVNELDGDPPRYDFSHARLRAVAYDAAGLARRRLLHRRVAAELDRRARHAPAGAHDVSAATIAAHHRAAGDGELAAQWLVRAAEHATALLAVSDAVEHYDEALALGYPDPRPVHEALGDLHTLSGRYSDALRHLEAAAALAGDDRYAALEHKIAGVHIRRGHWVLAGQHLQAALAALDDDRDAGATALRARILTDRGLAAHRQGDDADAATLAARALAAAEDAGDLAALAGAHNLLGVLSRHDLSLARHHLEHALALARRLHDVAAEVAAANNLAQAHAAAGAVERALPLAQAALARSAALGDRHRQAALHNNLADLLRASGRTDDAMAHLTRAVTLFAEIDERDAPVPEVWKLAEW